jgi:gamma-polyglutamate biosynthesis protein CapC
VATVLATSAVSLASYGVLASGLVLGAVTAL